MVRLARLVRTLHAALARGVDFLLVVSMVVAYVYRERGERSTWNARRLTRVERRRLAKAAAEA